MTQQTKVALHVLNAGMVLDRSIFIGLTVAEMQATLYQLRATSKKGFTVIDNGATFFTPSNMLNLIKAGDDAYKLIAEKAGVILQESDVRAIQVAETTQKAIEAAMKPIIPPYPFADTPQGFDITQVFAICKAGKSLCRIGGVDNTLGLVQAELIWRHLSDAWANGKTPAPKYFRDHRVFQTDMGNIRVGCQTARRYEIEQIAVWRGWKFPEPSTKA